MKLRYFYASVLHFNGKVMMILGVKGKAFFCLVCLTLKIKEIRIS